MQPQPNNDKILTLADIRPDVFYTLGQLAPIVGVSVPTLWRQTRSGRLTRHTLGERGIRILGAHFLAFVEASKNTPGPRRRKGETPPSQRPQARPFKYVRVKTPGLSDTGPP